MNQNGERGYIENIRRPRDQRNFWCVYPFEQRGIDKRLKCDRGGEGEGEESERRKGMIEGESEI